jgi:hypothetical protein
MHLRTEERAKVFVCSPSFSLIFIARTGELMGNLACKKAQRAPLEFGSTASGCYGLPPGGFLLVFVLGFCSIWAFFLDLWGFIDTTIDHLLQNFSSVSISCYKIYC